MLTKSTIRIIQIFAFTLAIFSSYAIFAKNSGFYFSISNFIFSPFIHNAFFTPFELLYILLLFNIHSTYKSLNRNYGYFIFALIVFVIRMINPNAQPSTPIFGMPLFSNLSEYLFLASILVFYNIPAILGKSFFDALFKYIVIFAFVKALIFIFLYLQGVVISSRYDYAIILPEPDSQFLFSFLGSVLFTLYLVKHNRSYLLLSVIFLFIVFFSMQRSTALTGIIALTLTLFVILVKRITVATNTSIIVISVFVLLLQVLMVQLPDSKAAFVINRYAGLVTDVRDTDRKEFSDTGHQEQSITTFTSAIQGVDFWGLGYGNINDRLFLEGQTTVIHNNYATLLSQHGIFTFLFFAITFFMILGLQYKIVSKINRKKYVFYLPIATAGFYLIGYFISAWFNSGNIFMYSRFMIFWFFIFLYLRIGAQYNFTYNEYERTSAR